MPRRKLKQRQLFHSKYTQPPATPIVSSRRIPRNLYTVQPETGVGMGIDWSLTAAGAVIAPFKWDLDWSQCKRMTYGEKLPKTATDREQVYRLVRICERLVEFAEKYGVTHVWVEQYAFTSEHTRAFALGEIGGCLKRDLIQKLGVKLRSVPPASARTLFGTFPTRAKKGEPKLAPVKDRVHAVLHEAGLPTVWTPDEVDAWVALNYGFSGIKGADALILREAA